MFKNLIEYYIRRSKNPEFRFDNSVTDSLILTLSFKKFFSLLRGFRFVITNSKLNRIFLGKSVSVFNKKNMDVGDNVVIGDYVGLSALGKGKLTLHDNVSIGSFSQVVISTSFNNIGEYIELNENVSIGEFSYLGGAGGLNIGRDTIIGQYFSAHPENHNFEDKTTLIRLQSVNRKGIRIGANCWLGAKVTVLDGVIIGDNCVIAAGAVVTQSFVDNVIIGGVPAKVIKEL